MLRMLRMSVSVSVVMMVLAGRTNGSDCTPGELRVTGGGVVSPGDNVSLTLCLDQGETCHKIKWSLTQGDNRIKCQVVNGEVGRCKPSDSALQSLLNPVLTEDNTCVMQLLNVTAAMEGTWEGETDWYEQEVELIIQESMASVEVSVEQEDHLVEDQDITVTCRVEGGKPRPLIGFVLMKDQQNKIEGSAERFLNTTTESQPEEGAGLVTVTARLRPSQQDQGSLVCCHAQQWDNSQPPLSLDIREEMTAGLNVLFGPKNLKINQKKSNGSHIVHVHFESNPAPSAGNVTFVIERRTGCGEGESTESCQPITVRAGSSQNNFNASALENKNEENVWELHTALVITDLEEWLETATLTLNIDNGVGQKIMEHTSITVDPSLISKVLEKRNLAGLIFFVILVLLAAVTGLVIYLRKKRLDTEREPLTNGPSMSSLQDK